MPLGTDSVDLPLRLTNIVQPLPAPVTIAQPPAAPAAVNLGAVARAPVGPRVDTGLGQIPTRLPAPLPAGEVVLDPRIRARAPFTPSLNLINEISLKRAGALRPDLGDVFRPRRLIPRSRLTLPICRVPAAGGQPDLLFGTLLEEPAVADPQPLCYVPRYKLAVEDVIGGQQVRVRLENEPNGGKLTVHLISYADPAIAGAARTARPLDAPLAVELRYQRTIGGQAVWDTWAFRELAAEPGGLQAVLHVDALALPQLHLALLASGTTLVVRRTIGYAVPVAGQSEPPYLQMTAMRRPVAALRRRPDDDGGGVDDSPYTGDGGGGVVIDHPPPPPTDDGGGVVSDPPPQEELFDPRSAAVEDVLACSFPASYTYIFQDGPAAQGQSLALRPFTRPWEGRQYTYYQDPARPWRFFYLPDAFKIARQEAAPRSPAIKISSNDGQVTMSYAAAPFTDAERLQDAARQLRDCIPPGTRLPDTVGGPTFELLTTAKATFRLALPQAGGASGPLAERPNVGLDFNNPAKGLPGGIYDQVTMSLEDFQPVFDTLFSDQRRDGANTLMLGEISITLGDTALQPIPFVGRLNDMVGELFGYAEAELPAPEYPDLVGVRAGLTNVTESPVRIDNLAAALHRTGDLSTETAAALQSLARQPLALPITLAPGERIELLATPAAPIAGNGPCDAVFNLGDVVALPDPEKVLDAIIDSNVAGTRPLPVTVTVRRAAFGNPADQGGALYAVSVRIVGRGEYGEDIDIDLTADTPSEPNGSTSSPTIVKTVMLYTPIRTLLLRESAPWSFEYRVTLRREQGDVAGESGTWTGTSLWPKTA